MKRMLQFKKTDVGYACYENGDIVFEILISDLQFDVKAFYKAFYSEDKDYEEMDLENCVSDDKDGNRIYGCIVSLMTKIKEKLAEIPAEDGGDNPHVDGSRSGEEDNTTP